MSKVSPYYFRVAFLVIMGLVAPAIAIYSHIAYWVGFVTFLMTLVSFVVFAGGSFIVVCGIFVWTESRTERFMFENEALQGGTFCAMWVTGWLGVSFWYWHCNSDIRFWSVVLPATILLVQGVVLGITYWLCNKEAVESRMERAEVFFELRAKIASERAETAAKTAKKKADAAAQAAKKKAVLKEKAIIRKKQKDARIRKEREHVDILKKRYAIKETVAKEFFAVAGDRRMQLNMRYCNDGKMRFLSSCDFGVDVIIKGNEDKGFHEEWQCANRAGDIEIGPACAHYVGQFVVCGKVSSFSICYDIDNHYKITSAASKDREFKSWDDLISYLDSLLN